MGSLSNFGTTFGFPAGIMCERLGPRLTCFAALLLAGTGYLMMWSTTFSTEFYSDKAALQDLYYFLVGMWILI